MGDRVLFAVRGVPAPQGSKRAIVNRFSGKPALVESSKRVKPWRSDIRNEAEKAMGDRLPFTGPLTIYLGFLMPRPKGHFGTGRNAETLKESAPGHPIGKPDLDKLIRAALDALKGIVYTDDALVVQIEASKRYAPVSPAQGPGLIVTIEA